MENKKLILLITLIFLAVLSLLYGIFTPSRVKRELSSKSDALAPESPRPFQSSISQERPSRRSDYTSWGRNPFLPKEVQVSVTGRRLVLDGIAWDRKSPRAVVNDRIVAVGDEVGGSTVVEIRKDRVILNNGAANFELRLGRRN